MSEIVFFFRFVVPLKHVFSSVFSISRLDFVKRDKENARSNTKSIFKTRLLNSKVLLPYSIKCPLKVRSQGKDFLLRMIILFYFCFFSE